MSQKIVLPAPTNPFSEDSLKEMLEARGLDFKVKVRKTPNPFRGMGDTGFFTSYRDDTKRIFQQGLSKTWKPIQNIDMFNCLAEVSKETDLSLADIRSFDEGRKLCAQVSLGKFDASPTQDGSDMIEKYLSAIIAHDGSHSLSMYISPYRWNCDNSITASLLLAKKEARKGRKSIITIQHSASATSKVKELVKAVEVAHGEFNKTALLYRKLAETTIDETYVWDILKKVFPMSVEEGKEPTQRKLKNWEDKIKDVQNRYASADGGKIQRDTAWNLYNAIQGTMQHYNDTGSDARFESVLTGKIANDAADAISTILEVTQGVSSTVQSEIDELVNA